MKKTSYQINTQTMSVVTLKQAPMLKKYSIDKPSEFEIAQLNKFGLTDNLKGVVATADGLVLCNYELVEIAKAAKIKEIEVTVIVGLAEDEIPQVIAVNNIRKRLSKKALANLIVDYRDYLTKNESGIAWADEVPGTSIDAKIGALLDYSYGMINGYQTINKAHPEFLKMMDAGEMSYTTAMQLIKEEQTAKDVKAGDASVSGENPTAPKVSKVKAPEYHYAGERNMVPCVPVSTIQVVYADGRKIDLVVDGDRAIGLLADKEIESAYKGIKENFDGGSEFHRLDLSDKKYFIELVIKLAA